MEALEVGIGPHLEVWCPWCIDEAQASTSVPYAVVFGVTTATLSPVPVGGTPLVRVPGGVGLPGQGRLPGAIGLAEFGLMGVLLGPVVIVLALALLT